jgi:hypothetical protein
MHAHICEFDDQESFQRLRDFLHILGAECVSKDWAIGVDVHRFRVDGEEITIYSDAWSVDVEGPEELVLRIVTAVAVKGD